MRIRKMLETTASSAGTSAASEIVQGDAARDSRQWSAAEECYRRALAIDGSLAHIWIQLGHALKEQGIFAEAEQAYRRGTQLAPDESDGFLQLGHLLKRDHRPIEALEAYRTAFRLDPSDSSLAREIKHCERLVGQRIGNDTADFHVYFDISDLVFYIGHHDSLSGIQRVQAATVLSLLELELQSTGIHFLSYVNEDKQFYEVDQSFIFSLLRELPLPPSRREITFDKMAARGGYLPESRPFEVSVTGDRVLCLIGAAWVNRDYVLRIRNLKIEYGFRFVLLIHDMIPVYARETCDQGTAEVFTEFLDSTHHVVDAYLCVSQNTRKDLLRYFAGQGLTVPDPMVTQEGSAFPRGMEALPTQVALAKLKLWGLDPGRFILFVSTIEGRKNHLMAFRAFEALCRQRVDVPHLVCVGRLGWRSEEFLAACEASGFLGGKIKILSDVSDSELAELYRNCMLTIYPSSYEGWGLPVGEALDFGKICIASNAASLPEVGGDFVVYVEPNDNTALASAIAGFLDDPAALRQRERRIREEYRPIEWSEVSARILSTCRAAAEAPPIASTPTLDLGHEYPVSLQPRLASGLMGEKMAREIWSERQRVISEGVYEASDYRHGQNARMGGGWCEPEVGHTWLRCKGAGLMMGLRNPCDEPLILYIAYQVTEPCIGARLIVEVSGGAPRSVTLSTHRGTFALRGLRAVEVSGHRQYHVTFTIVGDDELETELARLDSRRPALGLRSFLLLRESDTAGRLAILEKALSLQ